MNKRHIVALSAGAGILVAAGIALGRHIWKKRGEEVAEKNEEFDGRPKLVPIKKPSLEQMANNIIRENGYGTLNYEEKKANKPSKPEKPEETAYICTEKDYVDTYAEYEHHSCTWYPDEKRLVDLDDDFSVMVPIAHYIGKTAETVLLNEGDEDISAFYAVNHDLERVYEIMIFPDASYMEDMKEWENEFSAEEEADV